MTQPALNTTRLLPLDSMVVDCDVDSTELARFWARVDRKGDNDCWEIQSKSCGTHITVQIGGKSVSASRLSYELHHGPIPKGRRAGHMCRNSRCVNPRHLKAITQKEVVNRQPTNVWKQRRAVTHCPQGHEYSEDNIYWSASSRLCKICVRQHSAEQSKRKRALNASM